MQFYVSGPVVDELNNKDALGRIYILIEKILHGHKVDLPLRSRDLDKLSPEKFYSSVFDMIARSDGVISVLTEGDQSGPVESTVASFKHKPQCIMEMSATAPRLLRGLPFVVDVTNLESKELEPQVRACLERFLKSLNP